MPSPKKIGTWLYKEKICGEKGYDLNWGASVVGVIGGQGSTKTACCLNTAEKKMMFHPDEKIFWHDTIGSPCQYRKAKHFPFKIFVENDLNLKFLNATTNKYILPEITYFNDVYELYDLAPYKTINVVYFSNKKSWVGFNDKDENKKVGLIEYLMSVKQNEWQTIVFDEMETLFPAMVNNQTKDRWYEWTTNIVANKIKECRKSRVGIIGNYHMHSSIFHEVSNKFMFHIWGFGSRPCNTSVSQRAVNKLKLGEFWIDHQGTTFGKIGIEEIYDPPKEEWIVQYF